jgi:hypothetical protein
MARSVDVPAAGLTVAAADTPEVAAVDMVGVAAGAAGAATGECRSLRFE